MKFLSRGLYALMLMIALFSCRKQRDEINQPEEILYPDSLNDALQSKEELDVWASLTPINSTIKDFAFSNGLSENAKKTDLVKHSVDRPSDVLISDWMTKMKEKALFLTNTDIQNEEIKKKNSSQPYGLAYVWGGQNSIIPKASSSTVYYKDGKKLVPTCSKELFGLDCSGFIYNLMKAAGIDFKVYTTVSSLTQKDNWEKMLRDLGHPEISVKIYKPGEILYPELKNGDFIYWISNKTKKPNHIGAIFLASGKKNDFRVFVSNGSPDYTCAENLSNNTGPKQFDMYAVFDKLKNSWGIIRFSTQTIVYSGSTTLPHPRERVAAAGLDSKLFFAGGSKDFNISQIVDMYDTVGHKWTLKNLSTPRTYLAAAAAGTKIVFAGGMLSNGEPSNAADVFDVQDDSKSYTEHLTQARYHLAGASTGNKIVFAGGDDGNQYVGTVDIFDVSNKDAIKKAATILQGGARRKLAGTGTGNFIMFAGGTAHNLGPNSDGVSSAVDIYNTSSNLWTLGNLPYSTYDFSGAAANDKVVFCQVTPTGMPVISDVVAAPNWTVLTNAPHGNYTVAAAAGNFIVFGGEGVVDVYDTSSKTWQSLTNVKTKLIYTVACSTGKTVMLGGHRIDDREDLVTTIDIFNLVSK